MFRELGVNNWPGIMESFCQELILTSRKQLLEYVGKLNWDDKPAIAEAAIKATTNFLCNKATSVILQKQVCLPYSENDYIYPAIVDWGGFHAKKSNTWMPASCLARCSESLRLLLKLLVIWEVTPKRTIMLCHVGSKSLLQGCKSFKVFVFRFEDSLGNTID